MQNTVIVGSIGVFNLQNTHFVNIGRVELILANAFDPGDVMICGINVFCRYKMQREP